MVAYQQKKEKKKKEQVVIKHSAVAVLKNIIPR